MKRRAFLSIVLCPLLVAASAINPAEAPLLEVSADEARNDERAATKEADRLEKIAATAKGRLARLTAQRASALQSIAAAEAGITASEVELAAASARLALYRRQMQSAQQPAAALLAGLAMMAERPPILALFDRGGAQDLVETKILLDWTMPAIRARTRGLAGMIDAGAKLERATAQRRSELIADRQELAERQKHLATLEGIAYRDAVESGEDALVASDRVIAAQEAGGATASSAFAMASELLAGEPVGLLGRDLAGWARPPFDYRLPAEARVERGLGEVDRGGIRSRGLRLATARGSGLVAPADGTIRFVGPFRRFDGIIIIDHGEGWMSVLVNVAPTVRAGQRVSQGRAIGRALGPVEVELSLNGRHHSPALIAGSSTALSKGAKGR